MECKIDDLPDVLLEYILSLISPYKDLQECMLVSKKWLHITKNVILLNEKHFQKSVAHGLLLWSTLRYTRWTPTIGIRHSHSACTYKNSMYVFGGCTATCTAFNDLWRLNLDKRTWVRLITMGNYPSPKACATMLHYKKTFILFGGWSFPAPYPLIQQWKLYNELHVYAIDDNKWIAINTLESPPPMSAHSASIHKNFMVVFGGICSGYRSNNVWCLNLDTYNWHKQDTSNEKPEARYGQSQIELGDNHLLVLGGCTGPNVAATDAWLLKMEGTVWTWTKVNMHNTEWAPTRLWSQQACKVGNYVVVLSGNKYQKKPSDTNICQRTTPSKIYEPFQLDERHRNVSQIQREVNVNGRHGSFSRATVQNAHPLYHVPSLLKKITLFHDNFLSMAAFREEQIRNGSNSNRQRQLQSIRRMEEKIKIIERLKMGRKSGSPLSIYVLDITNVLCDECTASWIPSKHNNYSAPDQRILYSLVAGQSELVVFGGIRNEGLTSVVNHPNTDESTVYNDLHFIRPPRKSLV